MDLTPERIQTALGGRPFKFYRQLGSSNDVARDWALDGAATGAVVIADEQVTGRGRLGRVWYAPPNTALMLSVILRPPRARVPQTTMLGALAIHQLALGLGIEPVGIKWPNDVQIAGLKVSGVLSEAVWQGGDLKAVVLGMGVNVRIDFTGTPFENKAISLETALGRQIDRVDLLVALLAQLERWRDDPTLFATWKRHLVTLGQRVTVNEVSGVAEAVDDEGGLLIRTDSGTLRRVLAGDVAPHNRESQ